MFHLVFVTKYRHDVLSEPAIRHLRRIFAKLCRDFEAELIERRRGRSCSPLVHYPPKIALSKLVNSSKGVSSRRLRESRPEITGRYYKGVLWSPSSFVGKLWRRTALGDRRICQIPAGSGPRPLSRSSPA
ncbi:IS200/IS605 family transposase [Rhizobium mongolense]|uniref:IS200/IS605 family transposase n=1 Tax=Rhizobium mongolense TaxID=57676 RepID=UPI003556EE0A